MKGPGTLTWQLCGAVLVLTIYCSIVDAQTTKVAPQGLIDNFREVSYSPQTGVTFSFDLLTGDSRDITNRDRVQLQWQGTNGSTGAISLSVRRDYTTRTVKRYRFTVTPAQLPEDPLNLTLSLKLQCLLYSSSSCSLYQNRNNPSCTCNQWQYQGNSETIFMSAKRGVFDVDNFTDVTTDSDIMNKKVVFQFHLGPVVSSGLLSYDASLTWKQIYGNQTGVIHALKSTSSYCSYPVESYGQIEKVAGNTYRLSVPLILIGEGRLQVKLNISLFCSRQSYRWYTCTCSGWTVRGSSEYLEMSAKKGDLDVVNFKDVTTDSGLYKNIGIFEFQFNPLTRLPTSLGYDLRLNWKQVNDSQSGVIVASSCSSYAQSQGRLELVGSTGTYRLSFPLHLLGDGHFLVNVTINLSCFGYQYINVTRCTCNDWQIRGRSESLEITVEQGVEDRNTTVIPVIIPDGTPRPFIRNFQEVTTLNDSIWNVVAFSFDFFPTDSNGTITDRDLIQLRWESSDNSSRGLITLRATEGASGRNQLERDLTSDDEVRYHFTVNAGELGEGLLQLTLSVKLQCLSYSSGSYYCSRYPRSYRCTCTSWQYERESKTIQVTGNPVGDFGIVNFTDVTTESDLERRTAVFEFDFDPLIRTNPSLGYDGHLTWSQLDGQQSGNIAISSCPTRYPVIRQLERVGSTGTYRFSVPLLQLGQGRLSVNLTMSMTCNRRYSYSCRCSGWKVRGKSAPLEINAKRGSLSILNLQDISTPDDQEVKNAVFAFNTHPTPSPFLSLGYSVRLQWTAMSEEFSQYQRYSRSVHFPPESLEHCRRTSNVSLQQVGNGSYELTVPTAELGAGPLVISVSVSFACLDSWPRCTYCSQWRYTSLTSSSIAISAKRGSLAPFAIDLELWPKEECFEGAAEDAIEPGEVFTSLLKAIRKHADSATDTSAIYMNDERYLCERKGYLTLRGVLVKTNDFLATKMRDILADWLKDGARHIVVADRQINVKEGACGIALASLDDPPCDKGVRKKPKKTQ